MLKGKMQIPPNKDWTHWTIHRGDDKRKIEEKIPRDVHKNNAMRSIEK